MSSDARILELLATVDIFHGLDAAELKTIAGLLERHAFEPGRMVMKQGEPSDSLHLVETGIFEVFYWDDLLRIERRIHMLKQGDLFGEMGVLSGEVRSASVRCEAAGTTFLLGRETILRFLDGHPRAAVALARTLVSRVNAANRARAVPFERIGNYTITPEVAQILPLKLILQYRIVPLTLDAHTARVGMVDPSDLVARNTAVAFLSRYDVQWVCIALSDFEQFRDARLHELTKPKSAREEPSVEPLIYASDAGGKLDKESSEGAKALDTCLRTAIEAAASDLHFEPGTERTSVRARVDGRLVPLHRPLTAAEHRSIVSRLKVLAGLDITERRLPQDGAFRIRLGERAIDLRVSTIPTPRGEALAIRFLDSARREKSLRSLIVSEPMAEWIEDLFLQPTGLVLVTGPTGSGKTTTLYAGLHTRLQRDPTCKLVTAEDPVEYELDGTTQVQVDERAGLDFPRILRSLLRQDPNVVLIGEMRDQESMNIAIEAALTGHLVLSSLHTHSAIEAVARLRHAEIEPFFIASALRGIVSQRLVPKLCADCREEQETPPAIRARMERAGLASPGEKSKTWIARGCPRCRNSGVRGRIGVYEALSIAPPVQAAIEEGRNAAEILAAAPAGAHVPLTRYARHVLDAGLAGPEPLCALFSSGAGAIKG